MPRKFTVDGELYQIVQKYEALRPKDVKTDEFFLTQRNGKLTKQVIGINTFGAMPKVIATYLGLEEPDKYTGHSFRRTSATMLADAGADLLTLKRHGGWKSDKVAQGYVEDSISSKKKICKQICSSIDLNRQSSVKSGTTPRPAEENTFASGSSDPQVNQKASFFDAANIQSGSSSTFFHAANISSGPSSTEVRSKENVPTIELKNCTVTFNFTT